MNENKSTSIISVQIQHLCLKFWHLAWRFLGCEWHSSLSKQKFNLWLFQFDESFFHPFFFLAHRPKNRKAIFLSFPIIYIFKIKFSFHGYFHYLVVLELKTLSYKLCNCTIYTLNRSEPDFGTSWKFGRFGFPPLVCMQKKILPEIETWPVVLKINNLFLLTPKYNWPTHNSVRMPKQSLSCPERVKMNHACRVWGKHFWAFLVGCQSYSTVRSMSAYRALHNKIV